jgi:tRNA(adenine34) deaminase
MCVGALIEARVRALVFAVSDPENGAAGGAVQLARGDSLPHELSVVSGVREAEAQRLFAEASSVS